MINKDDALDNNIPIIDRNEAPLSEKETLFQKLKEILPNVINSDNILNLQALQDVIDLSETTANNRGYELTFAGKGIAKAKADIPTTKELQIDEKQSKDFDNTNNILIRGDNLDVLKILKQNYSEKIKCIYIDPPYNTENDGFVYNDNFRKSEENLIKEFGLKEETINYLANIYNTKTHSGWLAFMLPRLKLARELLTEDGVIFISIDDKEQANLKILCDEIFGADNFISCMAWRKTDNQANIGDIARVKEYILLYSKSSELFSLNKMALTEKAKKEYRYSDEKGAFRRSILLDKTRGRHKYDISTPSGSTLNGPWMIKEEQFYELEEKGLIYWATGGNELPHGKIYLHHSEGQIASDWLGIEFGSNQQASLDIEELFGIRIFDFSKPASLIRHFITIATNPNDIILDFFAGSGTTGDAVMQLNAKDGGNRKFILVQLDEKIDETKPAYQFCKDNGLEPVISSITIERIKRAGAKILEEREKDPSLFEGKTLDTGLKVFSLINKREIVKENEVYTIANMGVLSAKDRLFNLISASCQPLDVAIEEIEKDILYKANNNYYLLGTPAGDLSEYKDSYIYVDAYANIDLTAFLNITVANKENIKLIY